LLKGQQQPEGDRQVGHKVEVVDQAVRERGHHRGGSPQRQRPASQRTAVRPGPEEARQQPAERQQAERAEPQPDIQDQVVRVGGVLLARADQSRVDQAAAGAGVVVVAKLVEPDPQRVLPDISGGLAPEQQADRRAAGGDIPTQRQGQAGQDYDRDD